MNKIGMSFPTGLPTAPDVKKLMERWPSLKDDDKISYVDIGSVLQVAKGENRFKTIVEAWRKRLRREYNIELKAIKNEGFKVMTPPERVTHAVFLSKKGMRQIGRAGILANNTSKIGLSPQDLTIRDHEIKRAALLQTHNAITNREIKFLLTQK